MARERRPPVKPGGTKRHIGFRAWVTGADGQRRYARDYGLKGWPITSGDPTYKSKG